MNALAYLSSALARLAHVSRPLLAAGLAFQGLGLGLRGLAWGNILRAGYPDRPVPRGAVIGAYVTGVAANGILPATVVVLDGLAGLVPGSPGGLGSQQLVLAYALGATAATASIVMFSVGMQIALVSFQVVLGMAALMRMLRVAHPLRAMRHLRALANGDAAR